MLEGHAAVLAHVGYQGQITVCEGRGLESQVIVEGSQAGVRVGPRGEAVPDVCQIVDLGGGEEVGEVVG